MAIKYSPKVGEILECNFGNFPTNSNKEIDEKKLHVDGKIPPEMVKNRLVVVLNGKLNRGCLVVPLSSTKDVTNIAKKWHVPIDPKLINGAPYFEPKESWAKAELIQHVSNQRLSKVQRNSGSQYLPRELVAEIQKATIRVIGASQLITQTPEVAKQQLPEPAITQK